jgi:hypothetical protein
MKKFLIITFLYFYIGITSLLSHSGGLDQSGGHNCYVGSCKGTYHNHRGKPEKDSSLIFILIIAGIAYGGWVYFKKPSNYNRDSHQNVPNNNIKPETKFSNRKTSQATNKIATYNNKSRVISCPHCSSPMRKRKSKYGLFWGCSRYPSCRGTRNI